MSTKGVQQQVEDFFASYPVKRLGKGQSILRPGDAVKKVHYLIEGSVIQYDISPAGNMVIVNVYKPGTFFPMSCVLNNRPSDYFFEAASPVALGLAPTQQVVDFMKTNPEVTLDLLARVYKGTDGLLGRMTQLMGGSAASRVVFELLNASYRFGETNPDGSVFIALSENDIAKRSGLSRETVNRMVRQLKADDTLRITHQGIEISDIKKLEDQIDTI